MEITKKYFDKQQLELIEFLGSQFDKVTDRFAKLDGESDKVEGQFNKISTRFDKVEADLKKGFQEQNIKLEFIQLDIAAVRKDLIALSKRTKEDDSAFVRDLLKLKNRIESMEKEIKKLKSRKTVAV